MPAACHRTLHWAGNTHTHTYSRALYQGSRPLSHTNTHTQPRKYFQINLGEELGSWRSPDKEQRQKLSNNVQQWNSNFLLESDYADERTEVTPLLVSGWVNRKYSTGIFQALSFQVKHFEWATYKVEEAAADFVAGVRLRLQELLHHGQEVPVDSKNLLDVGEQNLRGREDTGLAGRDADCSYMVL